ncbi:hypothetical protein M501DRAFT_931354, partial [Patellaria atrata CBS 101060]
DTYDHRIRKIGHPVRSAILKPYIGAVVVEWVTISECALLYVYFLQFFFGDMVGLQDGPLELKAGIMLHFCIC